MNPGYVFKLASRNMWRHRARTLMTIGGIAVAIMSFGLLRTVVDSWYAGAALGSAGRLIVRSATSIKFPLPRTHAERIRRVAGVRGVTWASWFGGIYRGDEKLFFPQFAVDPDSYFDLYPEFVVDPGELSAFRRDRRGAIVGPKLARRYGWKIGDVVVLKGTAFPGDWSFTVRGIYEPADSKVDAGQFFLRWDSVDQAIAAALPSQAGRVGLIVVDIADPAQAAAISAAIDSLFRNSLADTRTETQKAFQLGFIAMVDTILAAIQAVASVVIVIIMAVMTNTMALAARERTREYATLKALGFHGDAIGLLILSESLSIAAIGGALGIALTFPLGDAFHAALRDLFAVFEITPRTVALQIVASLLVGALAAVVPALQGRRVSVIDGLRAVS